MEEKVSSRESSSGSESSSGPSSPASPGSEAAKAGSCSSSAAGGGGNAFANDGSFMELFKKKMEEERRRKELEEAGNGQATEDKKPVSVASFVGKRRGGAKLALKTGVVAKKQKPDSEVSHEDFAKILFIFKSPS
ncbi:telomerase RNA component interacting RNase-like [Neoarius graeffei]|uniref:telomerase RNA component interacting RNase-like n=1 Tax=Neoarius graeffei TaxID=443677 RepID=UPI00298C2D61|nr:telomerase RNA component interacting RNase-like [Neoarius graeffei]